jgi:uncharacterized protein with von Willebrand factor type A (vWA) domain
MTMTRPRPVGERLAGFARLLREYGLPVGLAEEQAMLQATLVLGATQARGLEAAWRAIACSNARQWHQWPELFERYWYPHRLRGTVKVSGATRPRRDLRQAVANLQQPGGEAGQMPGASPTAMAAADHAVGPCDAAEAGSPRAMGGAARTDALHDRSRQMWMPDDLHELQRLAQEIHQHMRPRPTRRWQNHPAGQRLALRATLRRSVPHGGLPLAPLWQRPQTRPPRLFLLVDVSRSMESHAAFFLRVARAFARCADARVFVFHVRLAEITPLLQRDSATVQEKINAVTAGFGAGTRIATNLQAFARQHARAQLGRDSRIWLMSDGFDTDAPDALRESLEALRRHGARITWFHPTRQRPASAALAQARSCVDHFLPLATLADLARARPWLH